MKKYVLLVLKQEWDKLTEQLKIINKNIKSLEANKKL